jgi:hypothetical protein
MSACDGRGTRRINYDRPNRGLLWQMEGRSVSVLSSFATNVEGYQDIVNGRYR